MQSTLAYAWLATVALAFTLAAARGMPLLHVFAPPSTRPMFWSAVAVLMFAAGMAGLQLCGALIFGQPPMAWAMLAMLGFVWAQVWCVLRGR